MGERKEVEKRGEWREKRREGERRETKKPEMLSGNGSLKAVSVEKGKGGL